ncbi:MAG: NAD-dependent epimerase/dehydratase family protein [Promethearchaeota archaeon]
MSKIKKKIHIVLGATGALGTNLVFELVNQGIDVIAVVRNLQKAEERFSNLKITIRQADLMKSEEVRKAIVGASVVYHCAGLPYTKWLRSFPKLNDNILCAVKKEHALLVYSDNLYMYGKMIGESIDETHPISKKSKKGYLRHIMAKKILDSHNNGEIKAVIARAGDFYGPFVDNGFCKPLFENPIKGKSSSWIGNSSQLHSLIYVKDMAKAMVKLAKNPDTYGSIWHIPGDEPISGKKFVSLIESEIGHGAVSIKVLSTGMIKTLGLFVPIVRELKELLFEWNYPYVINGSKYQNRFPQYQATAHKLAISQTLDWFKQNM